MSDLTLITTCKGRLSHLRETLPLMATQPNASCIVVDYGCPDGTANWVRTHWPQVTVKEVRDDPGFCVARARNIGAASAQTSWLCFVDADIKLAPGFSEILLSILRSGNHYLAKPASLETYGTWACERSTFNLVGGYDEAFRAWGGEDEDIYLRFRFAGSKEQGYSRALVDPISHDDALRTRYYEEKNRWTSTLGNGLYTAAKLDLQRLLNQGVDLATRHRLFEEAQRSATNAAASDSEPLLSLKSSINFPNLHHFGWALERTVEFKLTSISAE